MAADGPSHLTQNKLSAGDSEVLAGIQDWVSQAQFDPQTHVCIDKELKNKWFSSLCHMEFVQKVGWKRQTPPTTDADCKLVYPATVPD